MMFSSDSRRVIQNTLLASSLALGLACSSDDDTTQVTDASAGNSDASLTSAQQAELDAHITSALERFQIPGAAVGIVRGNELVYERGFGVRGVDDRTPVMQTTRFMFGSVNKSMTSLMLATLVDEGKLGWDDRMVDCIPGFELASPASTTQLSLRQALSHSSGIGRLDTPLFFRVLGPTELIRATRELPVLDAPGEVFQYHNQMYAITGYVGALAAGSEFDDAALSANYTRLMQDRVLSPVGMSRTTLDFDTVLADADHAWPHSYNGRSGALEAVPIGIEHFTLTTTPAGAAWGDVSDLAAYASTQLTGLGRSGRRVVSDENLAALHQKQITGYDDQGYAFGWWTREVLGMHAVSHDGDGMGFTSEVLLLPEADLGVVVLANRVASQAFYRAVEQFAAETVLGREHASDTELLAVNDELFSVLDGIAASTAPVSREQAAPYLGRYGDDVRVDFTNEGLVIQTLFAPFTLESMGEPGVFASGGVMNGRFKATFDDSVEPMRVRLDLLLSEEGVPQEYVLERTGE
ncbi:MAG TPA: serine hydrolase domain-containing protein [Polyangiaceae bacterium]|nr:serine hydrolase domain-containing protein [Polyangiaceae bacterium]